MIESAPGEDQQPLMANEIEMAAGEAVGGLFKVRRRKEHAPPPGTPCANCATNWMRRAANCRP